MSNNVKNKLKDQIKENITMSRKSRKTNNINNLK